MDLKKFVTETRNPNTTNLDTMSALEIVEQMNKQDANVPKAISKVLPEIAKACEIAADTFNNDGRLIYIGAGTSGRLGVLDASECPPTFGVSPDMVVGLIAGGDFALRHPVENVEDDKELAIKDLKAIELKSNDFLVGIAASGRTPYVISAIEYAKSLGCKTAAIACNTNSEIGNVADIAIEVEVGPEVLTGSTRLSAGSAQKMIVNMITTTSMVLIGKAYQNLMVDVVLSNEKLFSRAINIIKDATGVDDDAAKQALEKADGNCKLAITSILTESDIETAKKLLDQANGHVRKAIHLMKGEN